MIFGQNRDNLRKIWFDAWDQSQSNEPLIPLHQELLSIIKLHPEYHKIFDEQEHYLGKEYLPEFGETNPFLHMSMHQGIYEQLSSNRPTGIRELYQQLCSHYSDPHQAEHAMMEGFAETLWHAQRTGTPPDEVRYFNQLQNLLNTPS